MSPPPNLDRVQAVKWESTELGGHDNDSYPVGLKETEDALSARGVYFQPAGGAADEAHLIWRDEDDLFFQDIKTGPWSLTDLSFTETKHKAVRQLIHFIDDGPAEGFTSGAYREVTGTVFPTAVVWYDSSGAEKKKIVEKLITWTGVNATQVIWKIYDASEVLLATVTDAITYSGVFETSRVRTIA